MNFQIEDKSYRKIIAFALIFALPSAVLWLSVGLWYSFGFSLAANLIDIGSRLSAPAQTAVFAGLPFLSFVSGIIAYRRNQTKSSGLTLIFSVLLVTLTLVVLLK